MSVAPGEHVKRLGEKEIKEMAIIYKKDSKRPLSNYQKRVNEAAVELCLHNPGLLHTRKILMETARAKIIEEGFQFVKGKSRSKRGVDQSDDTPSLKRRKCSQHLRDERVNIIQEDCRDLADCIRFKENRIKSCENMRDYKKCDELKESLMKSAVPYSVS